MLYSHNKAREKKMFFQIVADRQKVTGVFFLNLHISGPMQFRPVLFKDQLQKNIYSHKIILKFKE